jgi:hypothetical protein
MVDEDVQPLRPVHKPVDEERGEASGIAVAGGPDHGGNVFRQQIHNSQRRRQEQSPSGVDRSDTLASSNYMRSDTMGSTYRSDTLNSTMSTKVNRYQNQMPSPNPFANEPGRQRRMDTYDYSSSEDEDSYELQQTYDRNVPQHGGAYNPVSGRLTDTGYHPPQGISPNPTPPPQFVPPHQAAMSPTGDLGAGGEIAPTPPPHAVGTMPQRI